MTKPKAEEYNPYFKYYIDLVSDGDFQNNLVSNQTALVAFFKTIPSELHNYKYEDSKWTIKDVLMHIIDTERVFAFRALVGLRKDSETLLYGMDENSYAKNKDVSQVAMKDLIHEFKAVRESSIHLYKNQDEDHLTFLAKTKDGGISPKALGFLMIGHAMHHVRIINERYLKKAI